uniref:Transposase n=1 Tax=Macrostomum lignano TaxID=282301 RepID=A0A1I8FDV3_9PLAT
ADCRKAPAVSRLPPPAGQPDRPRPAPLSASPGLRDAAIWAEARLDSGRTRWPAARTGRPALAPRSAVRPMIDRRFDLLSKFASVLISPGSSEPWRQWRQAESPGGSYAQHGRFPRRGLRVLTTGAVLARILHSPLVRARRPAWLGAASADEKLVRLLTPRRRRRCWWRTPAYSAALGNGTMGGGYERPDSSYSGTEIEYLGPAQPARCAQQLRRHASPAQRRCPPQPATPACPGSAWCQSAAESP